MLSALKPVLTVVPPDAKVQYRHVVAPIWDSCDGKRSTYGWGDVDVDVGFTTASPVATVETQARKSMAALGWHERPADLGDGTGGLVWTRTLPGGETGRAVLDPPTNPPSWSLSASAPPAVHSVSGC